MRKHRCTSIEVIAKRVGMRAQCREFAREAGAPATAARAGAMLRAPGPARGGGAGRRGLKPREQKPQRTSNEYLIESDHKGNPSPQAKLPLIHDVMKRRPQKPRLKDELTATGCGHRLWRRSTRGRSPTGQLKPADAQGGEMLRSAVLTLLVASYARPAATFFCFTASHSTTPLIHRPQSSARAERHRCRRRGCSCPLRLRTK